MLLNIMDRRMMPRDGGVVRASLCPAVVRGTIYEQGDWAPLMQWSSRTCSLDEAMRWALDQPSGVILCLRDAEPQAPATQETATTEALLEDAL